MARSLSPDEVLRENIEAMGEDLGRLHHDLWQALATLYLEWGEYVYLFGKSEERVELLNRAGGAFFAIVQRGLIRSVKIGISRITDPANSPGGSNLSICRYPVLLGIEAPPQLDGLIKTALDRCRDLRIHRNKRLAHWDLETERGVSALPPVTREAIDKALAAIANAINCVAVKFGRGETAFDIDMPVAGGSRSIVLYLERGMDAVAAERAARLRPPSPETGSP